MRQIPRLTFNHQRQQRRCVVYQGGIIPYKSAWETQRSLVKKRLEDPTLEDILLLLEHPPVYTLGTGSSLEFIKFDLIKTPYEVYRTERGGEVTYHCPGQLVGYPIINLRYYQQDLHWYLRQLEEVIIKVLQKYGLKGERVSGFTGVWIEGYKVAAIGIKVSRWITMHGFSLNVHPDLKGFERIIPCGIENKPLGSLDQLIPNIKLSKIRQEVALAFADVFQVEIVNQHSCF